MKDKIEKLKQSLLSNIEDKLSENDITKEEYLQYESFINYVVIPKAEDIFNS